jgi:Xaa-Pro aminopeptidase
MDGDWILADCAPDYHYYTSDIGRIWPINGTYSPLHRELYGYIVEYHKVILAKIRPGVTAGQVHEESAEVMKEVVEQTRFSKPIYEEAARRTLEFRGHLSHTVGMTVHDGGSYRDDPLEPGLVFSVDPQMWIPEERIYVRCEDTVVVTEDGIENFTEAAPLELDDVEEFMKQDGLLQAFPEAFA